MPCSLHSTWMHMCSVVQSVGKGLHYRICLLFFLNIQTLWNWRLSSSGHGRIGTKSTIITMLSKELFIWFIVMHPGDRLIPTVAITFNGILVKRIHCVWLLPVSYVVCSCCCWLQAMDTAAETGRFYHLQIEINYVFNLWCVLHHHSPSCRIQCWLNGRDCSSSLVFYSCWLAAESNDSLPPYFYSVTCRFLDNFFKG